MEYYSALKRKDILTDDTTRVDRSLGPGHVCRVLPALDVYPIPLWLTEICLTSSDGKAIDGEKYKLPRVEYIVDISFDRNP